MGLRVLAWMILVKDLNIHTWTGTIPTFIRNPANAITKFSLADFWFEEVFFVDTKYRCAVAANPGRGVVTLGVKALYDLFVCEVEATEVVNATHSPKKLIADAKLAAEASPRRPMISQS